MNFRVLLVAAATLLAAAPSAGAATIAYSDNHNAWLSSPDGVHKYQLTTGGDENAGWNFPVQGRDGKTIVAHRDTFEDGSKRPVLYLYGPDGKVVTANVMPVYAGATIPVYPIGMDMDWDSKAVAYGYSYCTFACNSTVRGYWLTFSDQQSLYPTDPQGQTDSYNPTFYGKRIVSSDSGGRIFVQPDVAEAPFTNSYQGWIAAEGYYLSRAKVSAHQNMVAIEWSQWDGSTKTGQGITVARHEGTVPSNLVEMCDLPVAAGANSVSFSPDGTQIAWGDDEGVKVAGVPNLADCSLTQPVKVISATGKGPSFGGGDVAAIVNPPKTGGDKPTTPTTPGGGTPTTPGGGAPTAPGGETAAPLTVKLSGKATRALFAKGRLTVAVGVPAAGKVTVTASVPARKLRARSSRARLASAAATKGINTVVGRGSASAKAAGTVTIALKPTRAAKRAIARLRGVTLTLTAAQGAATGTGKVKLR